MFHGLFWLTCGVALGGLAIREQGWLWCGVWPAVSLVVVGVAYLGAGPRLFGKRSDGRRRLAATLTLGPFLWLTWAVWHLGRVVRPGPACQKIIDGLWLGRRPLEHEIPQEIRLIIDMTAEFPGTRPLPADVAYQAYPTLDADVPPPGVLDDVVRRIVSFPHPVYLHCAAGRGRSALVAAATLIARGAASESLTAVAAIAALRPGIRLNARQWRVLREWTAARRRKA